MAGESDVIMKIKLRGTIKYDGVYHAPGTILDVDAKTMKQLIDDKVAIVPNENDLANEPEKKPGAKPAPAKKVAK